MNILSWLKAKKAEEQAQDAVRYTNSTSINLTDVFELEYGAISGSNGEDISPISETRLRSNMIFLKKHGVILNKNNEKYQYNLFIYNSNGDYLYAINSITQEVFELDKKANVRLVFSQVGATGRVFTESEKEEAFQGMSFYDNPAKKIDKKLKLELGTISDSTGANSASSPTNRSRMLNLIRVNAGDELVNEDPDVYRYNISFHDVNRGFKKFTVSIDSDSYVFHENGYFRIAPSKKNNGDLTNELTDVENNFTLKTSYVGKDNLEGLQPLYEKKLLNFGDSNAVAGYSSIISNKYNMGLYSYAEGGATIAEVAGQPRIMTQINQAQSDDVNPEYIIFNGLTNDAMEGRTTAGEITEGYDDDFDENTFAGGFEATCKALKTNWLGVKILYVRPHNMDTRPDLQVIYGDLALKICKKWSISVVDIYSEGGLNTHIPELKAEFAPDGTHPNGKGMLNYYVPLIEAKLKSI